MNNFASPSRTWFTSDHHFGHKNIIAYCDRPFKSVDEMNKVMVERWNDVVDDCDDIFYLGDFSLDFHSVERFLPQLKGTIHWVPGNHDAMHPMHAGHEKYIEWLEHHGVLWCGPEHEMFLDGMDLLLCHFPFGSEDHTERARFLDWRPTDDGRTLLCGHIHDLWKVNGSMINVGVDQWDFYPVSQAQIQALVENSNSKFSRIF